jgi:flavin-dependent dehydrogenase
MKINSICIVGGGTAGWMSAATFSRIFPEKLITLVESPSIATIGVGESTTQFFRKWLNFIDLDDSWMEECDATYKYSVRFENFNEKDPFHYPFISPAGPERDPISWFIHKALTPNLPVSNYAEWYAPQMKAVNEGRIPTLSFDRFDVKKDTGFHFDAVKFAKWLKENICQNVNYIKANVIDANLDDYGNLKNLYLDNNSCLEADLFVDCTGFRSYLINDIMKTPWETFDDMLPNDSAWTVRLPYTDKKTQMNTYTNCTALRNGWVWNVPLRNRIGTGYNYSSKFTSDEAALEEFKHHLGYPKEILCEYKNIKFKTGISKKPWNKNVLAIGLSGGFIEPLESNGLLSVHEWLIYACQIIGDNAIRALDINAFNFTTTREFKSFSYFVYYHYALSTRTDSPYWKYMTEQYDGLKDLHEDYLYKTRKATTPLNKLEYEKFSYANYGGETFIAAGHGWNPFNSVTLRLLETENVIDKSSYIHLEDYSKYDDLINTFPFAYEYYAS